MSTQTELTHFENDLRSIIDSDRVPADLTITYDDLHGLWGGSIFTVRGTGRLELQTRPRGAPAATSSTKPLAEGEIIDLVRLLVALSAWQQQTADSPPQPDESRPQLTIRLNGRTSRVWERCNDLPANNRLIQIKRWLETRSGEESQNTASK